MEKTNDQISQISIHPLLAERDPEVKSILDKPEVFQSTRSSRSGTTPPIALFAPAIFQSTRSSRSGTGLLQRL